MKIAFIDSSTKQVMAYQISPKPPAETIWESKHGYTRVEVPDGIELNRDVKLTVDANGKATKSTASVNSEQPTTDLTGIRIAELQGKIRTDTDTPEEFREYIKLRDNI